MLKAALKSFKNNRMALTAVEYAIIAGLVSVIIIVAVASIGRSLNTTFSKTGSSLSAAGGGSTAS